MTKKFGAANGQRIKALDEETIPIKTVEGVHRCTKFWSVVKPLISMRKVVQAGNVVVLGEKNPHIRKIETAQSSSWMSTTECRPWTCGCVFMRLVRFSAGKDSQWLQCHK